MIQVIVNIIVAILAFAIGLILGVKLYIRVIFKKYFAGILNVAQDPDDGRWYLSLALDKQPSDLAVAKFTLLGINTIKVDVEHMSELICPNSQNKQTP